MQSSAFTHAHRQYYTYVTDTQCKRVGTQCWMFWWVVSVMGVCVIVMGACVVVMGACVVVMGICVVVIEIFVVVMGICVVVMNVCVVVKVARVVGRCFKCFIFVSFGFFSGLSKLLINLCLLVNFQLYNFFRFFYTSNFLIISFFSFIHQICFIKFFHFEFLHPPQNVSDYYPTPLTFIHLPSSTAP